MDRTAKLQALLDAQVAKGGAHGIVAAVQSHDRSVDFVGAAGVADPAAGTAMTPETPYFIASITKMYTVAVVMRLKQEKRLDLSAPIAKHLPASLTRAIHVYKGTDYSDRITVEQLITMTSGLPDYETEKPRGGHSVMSELLAGHDRAIDTEEAVELTRRMAPHFAPGAPGKAYYSSTSYRLLGAIVESVTGKPLAATFQDWIFDPLGLRRTYSFDPSAPRAGDKPAAIFVKKATIGVPKYIATDVADGSLVSTASESVTFLRAFFEGQLFDAGLLRRMMTWNRIFFPLRYGYGLMDMRVPRLLTLVSTPELIGHSGSTGSFAFSCPSRSLYVAGTLNQADSPRRPYALMIRLADAAR
jgi:CubicO group peptidase (beta-lactamase class C family)